MQVVRYLRGRPALSALVAARGTVRRPLSPLADAGPTARVPDPSPWLDYRGGCAVPSAIHQGLPGLLIICQPALVGQTPARSQAERQTALQGNTRTDCAQVLPGVVRCLHHAECCAVMCVIAPASAQSASAGPLDRVAPGRGR